MQRILITGAAGNLGGMLRRELRGLAPHLRLTDIAPMPPAGEGEEVAACDLADFAGMLRLMDGVDAVLHFGAIPREDSFDAILRSNILGTYNVFEAARRQGVRRIVFASSNHAIGMYRRTDRIDADAPMRPDSHYGLAKCFGENLARMYWDKHGIEAACLRIGSCFPEPTGERMLATWLSYGDLARLVRCCVEAPHLGFVVVYGASDNRRRWWDNRKAGFLGWQPQDSADAFAERILAEAQSADPDDPAVLFQGGSFAAADYRSGRPPPE